MIAPMLPLLAVRNASSSAFFQRTTKRFRRYVIRVLRCTAWYRAPAPILLGSSGSGAPYWRNL